MVYDTFAQTVPVYSHRPDLVSSLDLFIGMAEDMIYNGVEGLSRPLRVQAMLANTATGLPSLPAGFLEVKAVRQTSGGTPVLQYVAPRVLAGMAANNGSSMFYTLDGNQLVTDGSLTTYRLDYYKRLDTPSSTVATNWILTNAPSVYLYGVLAQIAKVSRDTEGETKALRDFAAAIAGCQRADNESRWAAVDTPYLDITVV